MVNEFGGFLKGVCGGKKLPSDSTLNKMKKADLIELLHIAQKNYESLIWFYNNAIKYNEKNIPIPKWIPCSERLPEKPGEYLTCNYNHSSLSVLRYECGWNCFISFDGELHKESEIKDILAWIPLPEPYKEGV